MIGQKAIDAALGADDEGVPLSAFLRYIRSRSTPDGGCWVWGGGTSESGVPMVHRDTGLRDARGHMGHQALPARRALVEDIAAGPMPQGFIAARLCETRLCVNPFHTMRSTKGEQAQIAARRGAWSSPQKTAAITAARRRNSKFSEAVVEYVRTSPKPTKEVAAEVGMSKSHASDIRSGKVRKIMLATPFSGLLSGRP